MMHQKYQWNILGVELNVCNHQKLDTTRILVQSFRGLFVVARGLMILEISPVQQLTALTSGIPLLAFFFLNISFFMFQSTYVLFNPRTKH